MGKMRARTQEELSARRQEILAVATKQLMSEDYSAITLATIAKETSISRTSMYTYYKSKEAVFVDLMISEYVKMEAELRQALSVKMSRETFCRSLTHLLWEHPVLLKLLSLQLSVWDRRYDDTLVRLFVKETQLFTKAMDDILDIQFPDAPKEARNMFKLQFAVYCNSLYVIDHLPESQMNAMKEEAYYDVIPSGEDICYEGLLLLSSVLV